MLHHRSVLAEVFEHLRWLVSKRATSYKGQGAGYKGPAVPDGLSLAGMSDSKRLSQPVQPIEVCSVMSAAMVGLQMNTPLLQQAGLARCGEQGIMALHPHDFIVF